MSRQVFFISDGTGITAETFGHGLLAQFSEVEFTPHTLPYIDSLEKANEALEFIELQRSKEQPLIFSSIINPEIRDLFKSSNLGVFDLFDSFLPQVSNYLDMKATEAVGALHCIDNDSSYTNRIEAIHFALDNDDGMRTQNYENADIILVGVSRCGKTPTCIYMALQYGILAANYPITADDFNHRGLPPAIREHRNKLFGLTIDAERLSAIRHQRRANTDYASFEQCDYEVRYAEQLFARNRIPVLSSTHLSIEEISAHVLKHAQLSRRL